MTERLSLSLLLGLASTLALNWSFYREHGRASVLPPLSLRHPLQALGLLFSDLRWLNGFLVGILGWVLYIVALAFGPLSLVQAVSAGGIAILALLVWRWGGVSLTHREWAGVGISGGGLVVLGLSLIGGRGGVPPGNHGSWIAIVAWIAASGAVAAAFAGPAGRLVAVGAGLGVGAGLLYGAADVATKAAVAGGWWLLFVPVVLATSGLAFACLQLGFQRGNALATAGVSTVLTNAVPIVAGMVLFHEPLPPGARGAGRLLAFIAVVAGALLLTRPGRAGDERHVEGAGDQRGPCAET